MADSTSQSEPVVPADQVSDVYSLSILECCERLGLTQGEIHALVHRGTLDAVRVMTEQGAAERVSTASLRAYLSRAASGSGTDGDMPLPGGRSNAATLRLLREEMRDLQQSVLTTLDMQQSLMKRMSEDSRSQIAQLRDENRLLREMVSSMLSRSPASEQEPSEMQPASSDELVSNP